MSDRDSSIFKMGVDDDRSDPMLKQRSREKTKKEIKDIRAEKPGRRIILISILIACLLGILLFIAYSDIKKRVSATNYTGAQNVQNLTQNLESRFSSLSVQYAKIEDSLAKKILSLEKSMASLKVHLDKSEKTLKTIKATKADKKEMKSSIAGIKRTAAPVQKDIKSISAKIKIMEKKFRQELDGLSKTLNKEKKELRSDISTLSTVKINKKEFDLEIEKERKIYQKELSKITRELEKKTESLQMEIRRLKSIQKISEKKKQIEPQKPDTSGRQAPKSESKVPVQPGTIVEQDITE